MSNEAGPSSGASKPQAAATAATSLADAVVIDLGKHKKKRIKALRKGKPGKLMDKVTAALATLREQGTVAADAQPIIVIVRERRGSLRWPGL